MRKRMTMTAAFLLLAVATGSSSGNGWERLSKVTEVEVTETRVVASLSGKEVHVFRGDRKMRTYPIAVGKETHPSPRGNFLIFQIDWNPDWRPPDNEWSADADYKGPGEEGNPMGRVKVIYLPPYTFHGTEAVHTLGEPASHGSIRMSNPDIIEFATILMEASGAAKDQAWYDRVLGNPQRLVRIDLPEPIFLTIEP
jgi:hypothetical protein